MKTKLENHAELTVKTLETFLARRGWTTGLKEWEQKLLLSAYDALETPEENRKFGLKSGKKVARVMFPEK